MLSVKKLRESAEDIKTRLIIRDEKYSELVDKASKLDQSHRNKMTEFENNKAEANRLAREIGILFQAGKKEEAENLRNKSNELKENNKTLQEEVKKIEAELEKVLIEIPNPPHPSVQSGKDEADNEVIHSWGEPLEKGGLKPHWELAERFGLIDFEAGNKIAGSGFPLFRHYGAKLQRAMTQYFLDVAFDNGYMEFQPPHLVNEATGFGTGQLPDKEGQMYHVESVDLYLIPTSEVPLTNIYRDEIISEEDLPVKMTAYTPCYRREAGSHGKDVRGLNRLHQFDKVEIVQITKPEDSWDALENMRKHTESLLKELELPYRVAKLCSGDLGFASSFTYDLEVFSPGQNRWLEVSSVSNFVDFQANRMKLRMKNKQGEKIIPHTLNGSALALPRTLAALLENHQEKDKIRIPEVLHKYTGFKEIPSEN